MKKLMWVVIAAAAAAAACSGGRERGPVDVDGDGKPDGTALDTDGDGRVDAVDIDGDGMPDGEDLDGDGIITVWSTLGANTLPPTAEQIEEAPDDLDPDLIDDVDPMHPPPASSGGQVQVGPSVVPTDGTLGAISQGVQGSCAAFTNAALATLIRAKRENTDPNKVWASPAFLYERQVRDTQTTCNEGTWIHSGLDALVREGAATETEVPYRSGNNGKLCEMGSMAANGHLYRVGSWEMLKPFTRAKIKEALSAGMTIAFGVSLPTGFMEWRGAQTSGVFKGTGTCSGTQHCGGHAMLLVGYDDAKGAYRILNSWGTDWGDRGYMWWDYSDFEARSPYGYTVTAVPNVQPFTAPNAATFSLTPIGVATWSSQGMQGTEWNVTVRVEASEPVKLTKVVLTPQGGAATDDKMSAWLSYGNVPFYAGMTQPAVGPATATVEGVLRDGTAVTRTMNIQIPAPAARTD